MYAFRNGVWPKPMEGLDLFVPAVTADSSSSESSEGEEEEESFMEREMMEEGVEEEDWSDFSAREKRPRRAKVMAKFLRESYYEEGEVDVEGEEDVARREVRDFEIEKSQGLKMVLKKSLQPREELQQQSQEPLKVLTVLEYR